MKICILSYYYPPNHFGGSSTYIQNLTKSLIDLGHDVKILVPQSCCNKEYEVPVKILSMKGTSFLSFVVNSRKLIKSFSDFDIIHSNTASGILSPYPFIETFHHNEKETSSVFSIVNGYIQSEACKKAKRIITVSNVTYQDLMKEKFNPDKIDIVPLGIDYSRFHEGIKKSDVRKNTNWGTKKILLYVGQLISRKNVQLILHSLKQLVETDDKFILLIVGRGPEKDKLLSLSKELSIENNVRFIDNCDDNELPSIYAMSDVFLFPSLKEGFGLVLLEALASGKPIISRDVGIASELVKEGCGYLADTAIDFKNRILEIFEKDYVKMGEYGKRVVEKKYTLESMTKNTVQVYKKFLDLV